MRLLTSAVPLFLAVLLAPGAVRGQDAGGMRSRAIPVGTDTLQLDTLSIVPDSFILTDTTGAAVLSDSYALEWYSGRIILGEGLRQRPLVARYRVFPVLFSERTFNKDPSAITAQAREAKNPFMSYTVQRRKAEELFDMGTLTKSGSISRGVQVGNNQDLGVTSSLNLNLSGMLTRQIGIRAVITDNNIPFQPEGNTQQLQDFDQIYIQLYTDKTELTAGDFRIDRPPSYFMNFLKRAQGLRVKHRFDIQRKKRADPNPGFLEVDGSGALSKGKFSRQIFQGIEGNQGPYLLRGAEGEPFIIVIAGTEKVFIDGKLLERGQENDYIINYNTAEITFTSKQMISQDRRIVVEFQYSERNYSRSLFHAGVNYEKGRGKVRFNLYSEQDSKDQLSNITVSEDQFKFLETIGDDLQRAVLPAVDSVGYANDQVRYYRTDTLLWVAGQPAVFTNVYVQSNDPQRAIYEVRFSDVGPGNGDYMQVQSVANGRVFQWVRPDSLSGVRMGHFAPVQQVITPKQNQLFTLGGEYRIGRRGALSVEGALSNTDLNRYSTLDSDDDLGYGIKASYSHRIPLTEGGDTAKWTLITGADFEHTDANFRPIERFRTVEFERDWNLGTHQGIAAQYITAAKLGVARRDWGELAYTFRSFVAAGQFNAMQSAADAAIRHGGLTLTFTGSHISSDGETMDNRFGRFILDAEQKLKWFSFGLRNEFEDNRSFANATDSLLPVSYAWNDGKVFVRTPDRWKNSLMLFYQRRDEHLPGLNELRYATLGESYGLTGLLGRNPNSVLRGTLTYRRLTVMDTLISKQRPDNTLITRLEYSLSILKGAVTSTTFYEVGSGLESRKEFFFLEVPPGQGAWNWIDQNGNGVKELGEFVQAVFQDTARYIRVFTPTNDFMQVYTTQFNEVININPRIIWGNKKGVLKVISRFSDQLIFGIDRKTERTSLLAAFDPFFTTVEDTSLVSVTSNFRNTFFFNRSSSKVGADYTYQDSRSKILLANGFDTRTRTAHTLKTRWNITKSFTFNMMYEPGWRTSMSELVSANNYMLEYYILEPQLVFQPGAKFRVQGSFRYTDKQNVLADADGPNAFMRDAGLEAKYNIVQRGSVSASFNFISISYDGPEGNVLEFEMLEGLKGGKNYTWALLFQTKLGKNMQLNLQYNGRKSGDNDAIHTGNVQLRAFF